MNIGFPLIAYFKHIASGVRTVVKGLSLTLRHVKQARKSHAPTNVNDPHYFDQSTGIVTLSYPFESIPVPDHGRYRLHNEIDDCIVCDKCAVVCPVNCIEIVPIKSPEPIGTTSDGTTKRIHAATFDIDMAKCCYCGLCTSVCPTECLTMTKAYDYSEFDVKDMIYAFSNLTQEQIQEKQAIYDAYIAEKEALKQSGQKEKLIAETETKISTVTEKQSDGSSVAIPKPAFKPKVIPVMPKPVDTTPQAGNTSDVEKEISNPAASTTNAAPKPVFKPKIPGLKTVSASQNGELNHESSTTSSENIQNTEIKADSKPKMPIPKPVFKKPVIAPPAENTSTANAETNQVIPATDNPESAIPPQIQHQASENSSTVKASMPKPAMKPLMKPIIKPKPDTPQEPNL